VNASEPLMRLRHVGSPQTAETVMMGNMESRYHETDGEDTHSPQ